MNGIYGISNFYRFVLLKEKKKSKTVAKSSNMEITSIRGLKTFQRMIFLNTLFPLIQKGSMCIGENAGKFTKAKRIKMFNSP